MYLNHQILFLDSPMSLDTQYMYVVMQDPREVSFTQYTHVTLSICRRHVLLQWYLMLKNKIHWNIGLAFFYS